MPSQKKKHWQNSLSWNVSVLNTLSGGKYQYLQSEIWIPTEPEVIYLGIT